MKTSLALTVLLALLTLVSCPGQRNTKGIALQLHFSPATLTDFLFVNMSYEFTLRGSFQKLNKDYKVFVHFWRTNRKEMLFQDDHQPNKKTSAWQKGETIRYTRAVFIPQFLNEFDIDFEGYEEIKISVGLYDPTPESKENPILLYEKKVEIQPASFNAPEIIYNEGWNEPESDLRSADVFEKSWRWTAQKAVCIIENPHKLSTLVIKGGVAKTALPDQKVTFKVNDTVLDEFIPSENRFSKEYTLTPETMGPNEEFTLRIETDRTYVPAKINPANKDNRELGVQIFFIYFREKI